MNGATAYRDADAGEGLRIRLTREALAYTLILLVALALRAPGLGAPPLSEREAGQAMAAWRLLTAGAVEPGLIESPLAFAGAVLSFALFGASEGSARLLPMLAGVGLVLLPLGFRKPFGRLPMLIASALLALSPGVVGASRQMSGGGAAVLCALLGLWALWRYTQKGDALSLVASGLWWGLALLADFGTLLGALSLLTGLGAALLGDDEEGRTRQALRLAVRDVPWGIFAGALLATVFLVGTLLLTNPRGLGAAADLLARLASGVARRPPGAPFVGGLLLLYEPPLFLFGLMGLVRGLASEQWPVRFLSGWAAGAMFVFFVYPGATPVHVLWIVVPLAALAGLALADTLAGPESGPLWGVAVHALLVTGLLAVAVLWAVSFTAAPAQPDGEGLTLALRLGLVGSMLLLALIVSLLSAGVWGGQHAWRGLALGVLGLTLLMSLNGSAGLAYARASDPHEPWHVAPGQPALRALAETAHEVSAVTTGHPYTATVTVQGSPDGLLAWALRDFDQVTFVETPSPAVTSDMVVTTAEPDPLLGERYVGQDFVVVRAWRPGGLTFEEALRWALFREANTPGSEVRVILWVREDIYTLLPNELR